MSGTQVNASDPAEEEGDESIKDLAQSWPFIGIYAQMITRCCLPTSSLSKSHKYQ